LALEDFGSKNDLIIIVLPYTYDIEVCKINSFNYLNYINVAYYFSQLLEYYVFSFAVGNAEI